MELKSQKNIKIFIQVNKSEMPSDIQKMIDNREIGAALLKSYRGYWTRKN